MLSLLLLFFDLSLSLASANANNVSVTRTNSGVPYAPGDLIFEEDFNTLNLDLWHHEINMNRGGNNEFQIYDKHDENAYVKDGILFIRPTLTSDRYGEDFLSNGYLKLDGCTDDFGCPTCCEKQATADDIIPPIISARLRTKSSFSFKYGKVEVRAKVPGADWTWPAIWLLPEESVYGGWPASGEIDIMESRGNRQLFNPSGLNIGSEQVGSTLHYGPHMPHNGWWAAHGSVNSESLNGFDRDFHNYQLEWTPDFLKFSVDGREITTVTPPAGGFFELGQFPPDVNNPWLGAENFKMAPFQQNFHFILNVATGGGFFPDDSSGPYNKPWHSGSPTQMRDFWMNRHDWLHTWAGDDPTMQIDYIRVWAV